MSYPSDLLRWLQRKRYQYEVTFSLYMLTPTEKFVFNSFLFIFLSMIIIAVSLYLPEHIMTVFTRAWFYYAGDDHAAAQGAPVVRVGTPGLDGQGVKNTGPRLPNQDVYNMLREL